MNKIDKPMNLEFWTEYDSLLQGGITTIQPPKKIL